MTQICWLPLLWKCYVIGCLGFSTLTDLEQVCTEAILTSPCRCLLDTSHSPVVQEVLNSKMVKKILHFQSGRLHFPS